MGPHSIYVQLQWKMAIKANTKLCGYIVNSTSDFKYSECLFSLALRSLSEVRMQHSVMTLIQNKPLKSAVVFLRAMFMRPVRLICRTYLFMIIAYFGQKTCCWQGLGCRQIFFAWNKDKSFQKRILFVKNYRNSFINNNVFYYTLQNSPMQFVPVHRANHLGSNSSTGLRSSMHHLTAGSSRLSMDLHRK